MTTDGELEIYKQHRAGQDKFIYFLLAAVGAAVAFALNQTKGLALSPSQLPLGVAVGCWAGSFVFGCARLNNIATMLNLNQGLLQIKAGTHDLLTHAAEIPFAADLLKGKLVARNNTAASQARWQYRLLILGAAFYIGWHIYEMSLRGTGD